MATNLIRTSKKLVQALNSKGYKLTFSIKQYMGKEGAPHSMYIISRALWNEEKGKYYHEDIYSTSSMVRAVLFLRDMWYEENNWELPMDQEQWNRIREEIRNG